MGAYDVQSNSIVKSNPVPTFASGGEEGIEICHREYIQDISGTVDFALQSFLLNPGNSEMFPWLANVAQNFTQYELLGAICEFVPTSGSIGVGTPSLGAVVMASNYNIDEPVFASKREMESSQFCTSTVPCNAMMHPIECARSQTSVTKLYIRDYTAEVTDPHLYDWCKFQVATQGMSSAYVLGELWITYHVRLLKPVTRVSSDYAIYTEMGTHDVPAYCLYGQPEDCFAPDFFAGSSADVFFYGAPEWAPAVGGQLGVTTITGYKPAVVFPKYDSYWFTVCAVYARWGDTTAATSWHGQDSNSAYSSVITFPHFFNARTAAFEVYSANSYYFAASVVKCEGSLAPTNTQADRWRRALTLPSLHKTDASGTVRLTFFSMEITEAQALTLSETAPLGMALGEDDIERIVLKLLDAKAKTTPATNIRDKRLGL
jgi:hypothetical protein